MRFLPAETHHLVQRSFAQVLGKGPHVPCGNTPMNFTMVVRGSLYAKPATLGSCDALFTDFFPSTQSILFLLIQKLQDSDRRGAGTNPVLSTKKKLLNYNA